VPVVAPPIIATKDRSDFCNNLIIIVIVTIPICGIFIHVCYLNCIMAVGVERIKKSINRMIFLEMVRIKTHKKVKKEKKVKNQIPPTFTKLKIFKTNLVFYFLEEKRC
jgi:hypothetical protein